MLLWYAGTEESLTKCVRVHQAQKRTQSQYQKWGGETEGCGAPVERDK